MTTPVTLTLDSISGVRPVMKFAPPKLENTVELYHYYADRPAKLLAEAKDAKILKTDCFNEVIQDIQSHRAGVKPILGSLPNVKEAWCVEILEDRVKRAKVKFPGVNFIAGDIRTVDLPGGFDYIFDLSTIDHMPAPDAFKVIERYDGWLKPGGTLLIIAWLTFGASTVLEQDNPEMQYYFNASDFAGALWKRFDVVDRESLFGSRSGPLLVSFTCRKPGGIR